MFSCVSCKRRTYTCHVIVPYVDEGGEGLTQSFRPWASSEADRRTQLCLLLSIHYAFS